MPDFNIRTYEEYKTGIAENDGTILLKENTKTPVSGNSPIIMVGDRVRDYVTTFAENSLWHLGNFAHSNMPSNPVLGQLWYHPVNQTLSLWAGPGVNDWIMPIDTTQIRDHIVPISTGDSAYDIGSDSLQFKDIYAGQLFLSETNLTKTESGNLYAIDTNISLASNDTGVRFRNNNNGGLLIKFNSGRKVEFYNTNSSGTGHIKGITIEDDTVELYYSGTKKFETTSAGIKITGDGLITGNLATDEDQVANHPAANEFVTKGHMDDSIDYIRDNLLIEHNNLAPNAVHQGNLEIYNGNPNTGVATANIANGAVTNVKLGTDAVKSGNILNGEVTDGKLAPLSVNLENMKTGSVKDDVIASGGIIAGKLATNEAGQNTEPVIGANIRNNTIPFTKMTSFIFESTPVSFTYNTIITFTHNFARIPDVVSVFLKCVDNTNLGGYEVDDIILLHHGESANANRGNGVYVDVNNVHIIFSTADCGIYYHKTDRTSKIIDHTKWEVFAKVISFGV